MICHDLLERVPRGYNAAGFYGSEIHLQKATAITFAAGSLWYGVDPHDQSRYHRGGQVFR